LKKSLMTHIHTDTSVTYTISIRGFTTMHYINQLFTYLLTSSADCKRAAELEKVRGLPES